MITAQELAKLLGCVANPKFSETFRRVVTDSRLVQSGDLFVALVGPNRDGHDFIDKALTNGASGIACDRKWLAQQSTHRDAQYFPVDNTFFSLRQISGLWRTHFNGKVIAVAGSSGKTTTKEFLAAILSSRFRVHKTTASQNGDIGIPMTLLSIQEAHDIAIVEIGIDRIGAMAEHESLVRPDLSIVTSIGEEHLEGLRDIKTVASEETLLLKKTLERGGKSFLYFDDPWLERFFNLHRFPGLIAYSVSGKGRASVKLTGNYNLSAETLAFGVSDRLHKIQCPLPGVHNSANLMGAVAIALELGCSIDDINIGLVRFSPPENRSRIEMLPNGATVLIDLYNANPSSMRAALETIGQIAQKRNSSQIVLCLGDMLELGVDELLLHEQLAKYFPSSPNCYAFLYGDRMKALAEVLRRSYPNVKTEHFSDIARMTIAVNEYLSTDTAMLIKGSRGMALESIWDLIRKHSR